LGVNVDGRQKYRVKPLLYRADLPGRRGLGAMPEGGALMLDEGSVLLWSAWVGWRKTGPRLSKVISPPGLRNAQGARRGRAIVVASHDVFLFHGSYPPVPQVTPHIMAQSAAVSLLFKEAFIGLGLGVLGSLAWMFGVSRPDQARIERFYKK